MAVGLTAHRHGPAAECPQEPHPQPSPGAMAGVQGHRVFPPADRATSTIFEHPLEMGLVGIFDRTGLPQRIPARPGEIPVLPAFQHVGSLARREPSPGAGRTSSRCIREGCAKPRSGCHPRPCVPGPGPDGGRGGGARQKGALPCCGHPATTAGEKNVGRNASIMTDDN